ncbi:hypothetical protein GQ55_2G308200 [Panicum hallii var. hallii]|uniref:Uncharacterized protein n=1 Tax=Panicum hallii var. hallii TaxID=1504633 RepID=A0A2T7EU93_9POAL|nr:hypothetical protein GQ55_2G308200 [Panicum hallii var. hallii]
MELKFNAPNYIMREKEAAVCDRDNGSGKDESITVRNDYPERPVPYFEMDEGFSWKMVQEVMSERNVSIAKSIANDIIIRDPTAKWVRRTFFEMHDQLEPILKKDSVQCFLQFKNCAGKGISWDLTITSQTLTWMVAYNALRCAHVELEGEVPELCGMHANPNCINCYGYFPLHEAAERFSVDMIELLFCHGASANVRTVGNEVIEDLLPLYVEIENTYPHKDLFEDNLSPIHNHLDYIYKLIHLLCLPEMSTVLLLAAQEQIRGGCSSEINGSSKKDGFDIINKRILRLSLALRWEKGSNGMTQKLLEERTLIDCAGLLVDVISHAGEPLSAYIQAHSEVPHMEVLEHVSSILKEERESCSKGLIDANRAVTEMASLHAAEEKAARKEIGSGWDPTYTRRRFFPFWRSVLRTLCYVRVYPSYAREDARSGHWSVDLLELQIISLVRWEESLHLQAIISPKAASALLLLVHPGS